MPSLKGAIRLLPHLRGLTLTPMAQSFGELFAGLLDCDFRLDSLKVSYHIQHSFAQFLQSQPSIRHLYLHDPDTEPPRSYSLVSNINEISAQEEFLPNLELVSADPRVLASLVPGRPVSHVEIAVGSYLSNDQDILENLVTSLSQSTAPILSIVHIPNTVRIHFWGPKFLRRLKKTNIRHTLRNLTVCLPRIMKPLLLARSSSVVGEMGPIIHISQIFANDLGGFSHLESFELLLEGFQLVHPPVVEVSDCFDTLENLESWKSYCPTLRNVTLYGTELE
ncbi:hypothetical protein BDV93DRAFT_519096 [Ceratobasidium sp. AG-I]|nr:hypothetical protein BDV93DRAFT_519096 [Ceratobasidium sp. AG-I]